MMISTLLVLSLLSFGLILANPCPCDLSARDPLMENSINGELSFRPNLDDETIEDDFNYRMIANYPNFIEVNPLNYQRRSSLLVDGRRSKRPSWAAVGKRSSILIKKRPSWAPVG